MGRNRNRKPNPNQTIDYVIVNDPKNIKQTFMQLIQFTSPHGTETGVYGRALTKLGWKLNPWGFSFSQGTAEEQRTIFAAHLDDVSADHAETELWWTDKNKTTLINNQKEIIGADDKTGVAILLYLQAHGIGGTYTLFFGEEVGCVGSREWVKEVTLDQYSHMVSFDRRGRTSVITHQSGTRTCSQDFADAMAKELNKHDPAFKFSPDDTGSFTDSSVAKLLIPECTNISVGYEGAHSASETQDVDFLERLGAALLNVNWIGLPVRRNPKVPEYKSSGYQTSQHWPKPTTATPPSRSAGSDYGYDAAWRRRFGLDDDGMDDRDYYGHRGGRDYETYLGRREMTNKKKDFIGTGKDLKDVNLVDVITSVARGNVTLSEFLGVSWRLDQEIAEFFFRVVLDDQLYAEGIANKLFDYDDGIPGEEKPEDVETRLNKLLGDTSPPTVTLEKPTPEEISAFSNKSVSDIVRESVDLAKKEEN